MLREVIQREADGIGLQQVVAAQPSEDASGSAAEAFQQGVGLAPVRFADPVIQMAREAFQDLDGAVGGAAVHHDDFQFARCYVPLVRQTLQSVG